MILAAVALLIGSPEEVVQKMTLEEKVGQLFVVPACPERGDDHLHDLHTLIEQYHIGGILLKAGTLESYHNLYRQLNAPELLHLGDAEWGVSMRMRDAVRFPKNLALGAIQDPKILEAFGHQVGKECRLAGIHIDLAPVADVNTNPRNPVIGMRSFGDNPYTVAQKVSVVFQAMQAEGIGAAVKHYPGHGDTSVDSHIDLPVVDEMQLEPFQRAIEGGVSAILTAHLHYRPLNEVVTFSNRLVEEKLRHEFKFDGLVISDALNMGAVEKIPDAPLKALLAGHDILLYGDHRAEVVDQILRVDVPAAIQSIVKAMKGQEAQLDRHVIRIVRAKQRLIRESVKHDMLTSPAAIELQKSLYAQAVTVVCNQHIPLTSKEGVKIIEVVELTDEVKVQIEKEKPEILILYTSPYKLSEVPLAPTTIVAYDPDAKEAAHDILMGRKSALGRLPISHP